MLSQLGDTELPSDPKWTKIFLKHFSVWTFYMFSIYGFDLKLILFYLHLLCTGQPKIYRIVFGWMQLVRFWVLNETIWIFLVFQICWCEQVLDLRLRMPRLTVMAFLVYIHTWVFNTMRILCIVKQIAILQQLLKCTDLKPMIGHSLQMLHLAWCLAVSAAATRWRTGSHTMDWGSRRIQSRNMVASSSGLLLAWNNNMTGYGVTVFSQKSGKEEKKSGPNPLP